MWVLAATSCQDPGRRPPPPQPKATASTATSRPLPPEPRVMFAGCTHAGPGPTCELTTTARSLEVWVGTDTPEAIAFDIEGADQVPQLAAPQATDDGWRWVVELPAEATMLRLTDLHDRSLLQLPIRTGQRTAPAQLEDVRALIGSDAEAGLRRLDAELAASPDAHRVHWLALAGHTALVRNDYEALTRYYAEAIERARSAGQWALAQRLAQTLAYACIELRRDFACGQRWVEQDAALQPFPTAMHRYYRGLLAERRGLLAEATQIYRALLPDLRALPSGRNPTLELAIEARLLLFDARLGARAAVIERIEAVRQLRESVDAEHWASLLNTAAWALLQPGPGRPQSSPAGPSPRALLEEALNVLGDRPPSDDLQVLTRLNLAYDALERDQPDDAARWLASLDGSTMARHDDVWRRLLRVRLLQQRGELQAAVTRVRRMMKQADRDGDRAVRWACRLAYAKLLQALGDRQSALDQLTDAQRLLEDQLDLLALDDQDRFMAQRHRATERRVKLLVELGRPAQALCIARLARTRVLRALAQRQRARLDPKVRQQLDAYLGARLRLDERYEASFWNTDRAQAERERQAIARQRSVDRSQFEAQLRASGSTVEPPTCSALPQPKPGELHLHYLPTEAGWSLLTTRAGTDPTYIELGPVPLSVPDAARPGFSAAQRQTLADALLEPVAAAVRSADAVRVMTSGELVRVPIHALPFGPKGRPLAEHAPVVYGLDLPHAPASSDRQGPAVVVVPASNLSHARDEAEDTATELARFGDVTHVRDDGSAPFAARVLAALPRSSWFHYVGHARAPTEPGWDNTLVLSADGAITLGVADVFALPSVPRVAVLSGCQTGTQDPRSLGGGMSLAHALLLSGTEVVVATTHTVADAQAQALIGDLYRSLDDRSPAAVAPALARAQARAHARADSGPGDAWAVTRAWVR